MGRTGKHGTCRLGGAASADPVNGPQAAGSRLSLSLPTRMCCFSQSSQRAAGRSGRRGRAAQAAGGAAAGGRKARSGGAGAGGRERRALRGRAARAARGAAAREAERRGRAGAARARGRGPAHSAHFRPPPESPGPPDEGGRGEHAASIKAQLAAAATANPVSRTFGRSTPGSVCGVGRRRPGAGSDPSAPRAGARCPGRLECSAWASGGNGRERERASGRAPARRHP